jgi:c(7)-type cytochrome triheme protein
MLKLLKHALPVLTIVFALSAVPEAWSEYGDVVLNRRSEQAGMAPVVFPHWFHRVRFRCKVCHSELGFEMRAGANDVTMNEIVQGKFCGTCHNGEIAWSAENCGLCHSGLPGLKSRIHGGHETLGPGRW